MSSILKLFSVKAERETGEWLVSSLTEIGTVETSEHHAKSPANGHCPPALRVFDDLVKQAKGTSAA